MRGRGKTATRRSADSLRTRAANRTQFAYYSSGVTNRVRPTDRKTPVPELSEHKRLRRLPTLIACMLIAASLLYSLTLSSNPRIRTIDNQASPYRGLEDYAGAAEDILRSKITNATKLTIDTSSVEAQLLEQFPELSAAAIRLPVLGRRPSLILEIDPPALLLVTAGKSFVLNKSGAAIAEVSSLAPESRAGLAVVSDQSGLPVQAGDFALPGETIRFVKQVVAYLKEANLNITELTLPRAANQLDIRLQEVPYYIKVDVSGNARLQIGSFLAVKGSLESQRITPAEYIDVRVEEKVFYR